MSNFATYIMWRGKQAFDDWSKVGLFGKIGDKPACFERRHLGKKRGTEILYLPSKETFERLDFVLYAAALGHSPERIRNAVESGLDLSHLPWCRNPRILGYVRDAMVARAFGGGPLTDAFYAAFRLSNLFRRMLGEGPLSTAFVPVFSDHLARHEETEARSFFQKLFTVLGVVLLVGLLDLALAEKDHATRALLDWFVTEQVEEQAVSSNIHTRLKLISGDPTGILALDRELGARTYVVPAPLAGRI